MTIRDRSARHSCDVCVPCLALRDDPCHESNDIAGFCVIATASADVFAESCVISSAIGVAGEKLHQVAAKIWRMVKAPETLDEAIGRVVADIRNGMGMTQSTFADSVAHVSARSFSDYERGRASFPIRTLVSIADEAGMDVGELIRDAQQRLAFAQSLRKRAGRQQGR